MQCVHADFERVTFFEPVVMWADRYYAEATASVRRADLFTGTSVLLLNFFNARLFRGQNLSATRATESAVFCGG